MRDFAELGIEVDSSDVVMARAELRRLARAGGQTEQAVAGQTGRMSSMFRRLAATAGTIPSRLASGLGDIAGSVTVQMAALVTTAAATFGLLHSVTLARDFNAALAETSTLIAGTSSEIDTLTSSSSRMAMAYGVNATEQMRAFYQAISAGAGTVENASTLVDQANRLAIGGVTSLTNAVDTLTLSTNAYSAAGLTAADAADILFTGVRFGRTTMNELGASLGNVVPIASAVGIGLDEVVGAAAALTTQGQSTAMAMTGIRAIISAVIAPTAQAANAAGALGLQFNAAALRAQGLRGFLRSVSEAAGGNQEVLATLFGSVEALNAVLAFTGGASAQFDAAMAAMGERAGAADEAFNRVSASLDQRLTVQLGLLTEAARQFGGMLLAIVVPVLETITGVIATVGRAFSSFGEAIGGYTGYFVAAAGAVTAYFLPSIATAAAGLVSTLVPAIWGAITATYGWAASLITLRGALIATGIGALVVAAGIVINYLLDLKEKTGGWGNALSLLGDVAVGVWAGIRGSAAAIPPALNAVWSRVASGFYSMVSGLASAWAGLVSQITSLDLGGIDTPFGSVDFGQIQIPGADAIIAASNNLATQMDRRAIRATSDALIAHGEAASIVSDSFDDARAALAALNAAMAEGGEITTNTTEAVATINKALANTPAAATGAAGGISRVGAAAEAVQSRIERIAGGLSRFLVQLTGGANTALQAISELLSRAGEMLLNRGLMSLLGGTSLGSGGGGHVGGLLELLFNANGNVYQSPSLSAYSGQVVSTPTLFAFARGAGVMGEAGPEAIMPLKRGSDGKLGVAATGGRTSASTSVIRIDLSPGLQAEILAQAAQQSVQISTQVAGAASRAQDRGFRGRMVSLDQRGR